MGTVSPSSLLIIFSSPQPGRLPAPPVRRLGSIRHAGDPRIPSNCLIRRNSYRLDSVSLPQIRFARHQPSHKPHNRYGRILAAGLLLENTVDTVHHCFR